MKKIVIFGGGSGLSQILKGLKLFPVNITAVVSVSDDGRSTGRLRQEMNIPAVGDITKVMVSMANINEDMTKLMNYRFTKSKSLGNHSVKNLLLTALLDIKGNFASSLPIMEDILDIKNGKVLPLTEDSVHIIGITENGNQIVGEEQITASEEKIVRIIYDKPVTVNEKVFKAVNEADLIIFSSGSLHTSIIPHLVCEDLTEAIVKSKAKKMYLCNLFTQPGETDDFKVSDHVNMLEQYLGEGTIDLVVANSKTMSSALVEKYSVEEQKNPVVLDKDVLEEKGIYVISDKLYKIDEGVYRHDSLKTAYLIFSYLMEGKK
ncbi:MAG: YvcK family protein [Bacilli bacterium]|nr:YvcK family protein [Bacilli bacterium]